MGLKIGVLGLPNAGKSTLFNALIAGQKAAVAAHPFTTIDKNIGVVEIPDDTLFTLAKIENISKLTLATITFIDIAGLIKGAHLGEGLGNQFLSHIREVDLILHLVRSFKNPDISHVHGSIDQGVDIEVVNEELLFADLQTLDKRLTKEKISANEQELIKKFIEHLNKGTMAMNIKTTKEEQEVVSNWNLLTLKKQVLIANIGEEDINKPPKKINSQAVLSICAKLEAELSELPKEEQQQFLKSYGLVRSANEEIIKTCYDQLEMITFYTIAKRNEARAWPIKIGATAIEAAAKVHTDFAAHFIKAEVINASELIKIGSWLRVHELGKITIHGRDYFVQNQDVLEFKTSIRS